MKKQVNLYVDNIFKYRQMGSRTWITIVPGHHTLMLVEGARYEMMATTTITHMKIKGSISNVVIESSSLRSLEDSFSGSSELETVSITSSKPITTMEDTFNGSGILSFQIPIGNVTNFDRTFMNTDGIVTANIDTSNATTMVDTFKNSTVKTINKVLPFKDNFEGLIDGAKGVSIVDGIPLASATIKSANIRPEELSDKMIEEMDILFCRGEMIEIKDYVTIDDNIVDPTQRFEASINHYEFDRRDEITNPEPIHTLDSARRFEMEVSMVETDLRDFAVNEDTFDTDSDASYRFEMDALHYNRLKTNRIDTQDFTLSNVDDTYDQTYNYECDLKITDVNRKNTMDTAPYTGDDSNVSIDTNLSFESELKIGKIMQTNVIDTHTIADDEGAVYDQSFTFEAELIPKTNVEIHSIDTSLYSIPINSTFNSTYTLEIDIIPDSIDIDPFGDGSCMFAMNDTAEVNLVTGDALPSSTKPSTHSDMINPVSDSPISYYARKQSVGEYFYSMGAIDVIGKPTMYRDSFNKTVSFHYRSVHGTSVAFMSYAVGMNGLGFALIQQYNQPYISGVIIYRLTGTGLASFSDTFNFDDSPSTKKPTSEGMMTVVINPGSVDLYFGGVFAGTYTHSFIQPFTPEKIKIGGTDPKANVSLFRSFNRRLTPNEIRKL